MRSIRDPVILDKRAFSRVYDDVAWLASMLKQLMQQRDNTDYGRVAKLFDKLSKQGDEIMATMADVKAAAADLGVKVGNMKSVADRTEAVVVDLKDKVDVAIDLIKTAKAGDPAALGELESTLKDMGGVLDTESGEMVKAADDLDAAAAKLGSATSEVSSSGGDANA